MYSWPTGVTSGSEDMSTSERSHFSSFTDSVVLLPSDFTVPRLPAGKFVLDFTKTNNVRQLIIILQKLINVGFFTVWHQL